MNILYQANPAADLKYLAQFTTIPRDLESRKLDITAVAPPPLGTAAVPAALGTPVPPAPPTMSFLRKLKERCSFRASNTESASKRRLKDVASRHTRQSITPEPSSLSLDLAHFDAEDMSPTGIRKTSIDIESHRSSTSSTGSSYDGTSICRPVDATRRNSRLMKKRGSAGGSAVINCTCQEQRRSSRHSLHAHPARHSVAMDSSRRGSYPLHCRQPTLPLLFYAIQYKNSELLTQLLGDMELSSSLLNYLNEDGIACMHFASIVGWAEGVQLLHAHGACLNLVDARGQYPLYYADIMEQSDAYDMLHQLGAHAGHLYHTSRGSSRR